MATDPYPIGFLFQNFYTPGYNPYYPRHQAQLAQQQNANLLGNARQQLIEFAYKNLNEPEKWTISSGIISRDTRDESMKLWDEDFERVKCGSN